MTKAELVSKIAEEHNLSKSKADKILKSVFENISKALEKGERVAIPDFGIFDTRERKERVGRNPKTGEEVIIPAKRVPYFRASKRLKTRVNE
jgi:DNA-binding protein HU-beta